MALIVLVTSLSLGLAGCWFSPGKEGFVCTSSRDCNKGLRCIAFGYGRKQRKQCRKYGTHSISSKSGYTTFAIYLSYTFWISLPIGIIVFLIYLQLQHRKNNRSKEQESTTE
jgi:hypothetical protein